ncbi:MAG: ribosome recycling factor [Myxococcota bacterium]|nr:ribosome recycling factor [Myxococcota bacterium]MEC8423769.1 ribosome recycling factor [Myxococcota bacterium]
MTSEYLDAMKEDFGKVDAHLARELTTVRTGRASPQILENLQVEVASYGAKMPINQLATITAPDARMLVVNPWDKGTIPDIEKGIAVSGLNLNPSNDGQIIRVPIPALTGERRKQLVRQVGQFLEAARVRARAVRKEYNDIFKELEAEKEISEDELKRMLDQVQKGTDACVQRLEAASSAKEQEVLEG